jgi:hypothetical protein
MEIFPFRTQKMPIITKVSTPILDIHKSKRHGARMARFKNGIYIFFLNLFDNPRKNIIQ